MNGGMLVEYAIGFHLHFYGDEIAAGDGLTFKEV
jgi:hypothetical protein